MKQKFNKYLLLGILIGLSVSVVSVYAATTYLASDVKYKDTTVESALNDLYSASSEKYVRYNKATKNVEIYNATLNKYISIKHYSYGIPLNGMLYLNGKQNIDFEEVDRTEYEGINHELKNDYILIFGDTNGGGGGLFTTDKINLNGYSKLIIEGTIEGSNYSTSSHGLYGLISESKLWGSSYDPSNTVTFKKTGYKVGENTIEIDVSSFNDEYYIGVGVNQCSAKIKRIELQ